MLVSTNSVNDFGLMKFHPFYHQRFLPHFFAFLSVVAFLFGVEQKFRAQDSSSSIMLFVMSFFLGSISLPIYIATQSYVLITEKDISYFDFQGKVLYRLEWSNINYVYYAPNSKNSRYHFLFSPNILTHKQAKSTVNKCESFFRGYWGQIICFYLGEEILKKQLEEYVATKNKKIRKYGYF